MIVVSDTSPITNLIKIGRLDILQNLFNEVIIPSKVYEELVNYEQQLEEVRNNSWIIVKTVKDSEKVQNLLKQLDPGEAEAIILAQELDANVLIIDERKGRALAEGLGLKIVGLIGILVQAKKLGLISELKPIMIDLVENIGFRLAKELVDRILFEVGEN
jgi:predicted nucleic acid-binding protein